MKCTRPGPSMPSEIERATKRVNDKDNNELDPRDQVTEESHGKETVLLHHDEFELLNDDNNAVWPTPEIIFFS